MDHFYQVAKFNREVIGIDVDFNAGPRPIPLQYENITVHMLKEELTEVLGSINSGDVPGTVDGLGDLIVVALGALYKMGVNADDVLKEICRSNLTKARGSDQQYDLCRRCHNWVATDDLNFKDGACNHQAVYDKEPTPRGSSVDAVKPPTFSPADIASCLFPGRWPVPLSPVFVEAAELRQRKSRDYGAGVAQLREYFPFGIKSVFQDIWRKTLRLKALLVSGASPSNESIRDSFVDLINYASFGVEGLDEQH